MTNRMEMSGTGPLVNGQMYVSPAVETVDIELRDLIAVSGDNVVVHNPWGDEDEKEW